MKRLDSQYFLSLFIVSILNFISFNNILLSIPIELFGITLFYLFLDYLEYVGFGTKKPPV